MGTETERNILVFRVSFIFGICFYDLGKIWFLFGIYLRFIFAMWAFFEVDLGSHYLGSFWDFFAIWALDEHYLGSVWVSFGGICFWALCSLFGLFWI